MKKRFLSILLVIAMLASFCVVPAFAAEGSQTISLADTTTAGQVKITVTGATGDAAYRVYVLDADHADITDFCDPNTVAGMLTVTAAKDWNTFQGDSADYNVSAYSDSTFTVSAAPLPPTEQDGKGVAECTTKTLDTGADAHRYYVVVYSDNDYVVKDFKLKNGKLLLDPLEGDWATTGDYTKVYDGNAFAPTAANYTVTTSPAPAAINYVYYTKNGDGNYTKLNAAPVNVGTYYVNATADGYSEDEDYQEISITAKPLTIAAGTLAVTDKEYDSTTTATTTGAPVLTGVVGSDAVSAKVKTAAAFASANAADGITVSVEYELDGAGKGNYSLADGSVSLTGNIKPAKPTFTFAGKDGAEIAEGTLLKDILVTVKGVGSDVLTAGNGEWTDPDGHSLDADTTAVAPETEYTYTYTPDATESNYTTNSGKYVLGQTKATVTFTVDTAKGSIPAGKGTAEVDKNTAFEASFPTVTAKEAYKFKGWAKKGTTDIVDVKTVTVADDTEFVAIFEDREFHKAILLGRKDTTLFAPNDNLNRAEAATILSRLYEGDELFNEEASPVQHAPTGFTDVADSKVWFYGAVGFAQDKKLIEGKSATSFAPNANITRAEFATMLTRLLTNKTEAPEVDISKSKMTGIQGHWAEKYIVYLELETGGVKGKVGTDFKPNDNLTRAEAAKMMNAVIGRLQSDSAKEADQLAEELNIFTDVERCTWYYNNVIEATVGHYADDSDFHTAG